MTKRRTDEATLKIYSMLLERFGEPIGKQPSTAGIPDEGPGGKALWDDEPKKDREWSDPNVVKEGDGCCAQCGMMPMQMDQGCSCHEGDVPIEEKAPPGYEKVVKGLKKDKSVDNPWAVAWSMKNKGIKPKK